VQEVLRRTVLIENVTRYLTWRESTVPEGAFIAEVARRTGCGILLDLNNIHVNAINFHLDPFDMLTAIPAACVAEIHLAGFDRIGRRLIDTHGQPVSSSVWGLYQWTVDHIGPRPTLIEWDTNMPPLAELVEQARQADTVLGGCRAAV
jgi:uncharacterized protein